MLTVLHGPKSLSFGLCPCWLCYPFPASCRTSDLGILGKSKQWESRSITWKSALSLLGCGGSKTRGYLIWLGESDLNVISLFSQPIAL